MVGDDALPGIRAVVTRNVPANSVVTGVPAKVLRDRYDDPGRLTGSVPWELGRGGRDCATAPVTRRLEARC